MGERGMKYVYVAAALSLAILVAACGSGAPAQPPKLKIEPKVTVTGLDEIVKMTESGLSENQMYISAKFEKVQPISKRVPVVVTLKAGGQVLETTKMAFEFDVVVTETPYELSFSGRVGGKEVDEVEIALDAGGQP